VRLINYCGGSGTNIIGCARVGGNGMAVVREGSPFSFEEGSLWLHEYGHNAGLNHNADSRYVMYGCLCGSNLGLTQAECNTFHTPVSGAGAVLADLGQCTDDDDDEVLDQVDNCPGIPNNTQADGDGDGTGDVCESGPTVLDVDGNGASDPLSDGLLIARYLFGFRGSALIVGAVGSGCTRCNATQLESRLAAIRGALDVDADGEIEPLTDGVLVVRWLFGFRGADLVRSAVDEGDCTRCSASAIAGHLAGLS
jgi:hypothetical protein